MAGRPRRARALRVDPRLRHRCAHRRASRRRLGPAPRADRHLRRRARAGVADAGLDLRDADRRLQQRRGWPRLDPDEPVGAVAASPRLQRPGGRRPHHDDEDRRVGRRADARRTRAGRRGRAGRHHRHGRRGLSGVQRGQGGADRSGALLPYQTLAATLPESDQQQFRALRDSLLAAESVRARTTRWPDVASLALPGPDYRWTRFERGDRHQLPGTAARSVGPAWLLEIQEPEPSMRPIRRRTTTSIIGCRTARRCTSTCGCTATAARWPLAIRPAAAEQRLDEVFSTPPNPVYSDQESDCVHAVSHPARFAAAVPPRCCLGAAAGARRAQPRATLEDRRHAAPVLLVDEERRRRRCPATRCARSCPGEIDAGDYQPRPEDIKKLADLDAIVVNGIGHDDFILADDQGVGQQEDRRHPRQRGDAADSSRRTAPASTRTRSSRSPTRSSRPTRSRRRSRRCGRRTPRRCSRTPPTTRGGCALIKAQAAHAARRGQDHARRHRARRLRLPAAGVRPRGRRAWCSRRTA